MGFRKDNFAKVWEVTPVGDASTKVRISVSRKNKQTGEYEQEFSGWCMVYGTAAAKKAAALKGGERIKLGDVDVTTTYNKEQNKTYTNFKIFDFSLEGGEVSQAPSAPSRPSVDDGEPEDDRELPF